MTKYLTALVLGLVLSFSVSAAPVFLYPNCHNNPAFGECTLVNTTGKIVTCSIQAHGQTLRGARINGFEYVTLYQGMYAWIRVFAYNPNVDPLVYVRADAFCNTLN
jgi:hypothetical protein